MSVRVAPSGLVLGGSPSSSNTKRCWPAGAPSTGDRDRQRPVRRRAFGEQLDRAGRRDIDEDALVLALHRAHRERLARADLRCRRHQRLVLLQPTVLRAGFAGDGKLRLAFGRNADLLADRVVGFQHKRDGLRGILRDDVERKHHALLIADRRAALVGEPMRRRIAHRHGLHILRARKNRSAAESRSRPDSANRSSSPARA